jgi:hypothetical protein
MGTLVATVPAVRSQVGDGGAFPDSVVTPRREDRAPIVVMSSVRLALAVWMVYILHM